MGDFGAAPAGASASASDNRNQFEPIHYAITPITMKSTLVETVKFCFTGTIISRLSQFVDEPEAGVENGLAIAVPLVLDGLLRQTEQGVAPVALLHLVRDADAEEVLGRLADPPKAALYERGANLLLDMLGSTYRQTVNQMAVDAGIRPSAGGTLLQVATTAVVGVLGRFATENDLTAPEFVLWLQSQKDTIGVAMLRTGGAGFATTAMQRQPAATPPRVATAPVRLEAARADAAAHRPEAARSSGAAGFRWQWGAMLLLAVSLGYFFGRDFFGLPQQLAGKPSGAALVPVAAPAPALAAEAPATAAAATTAPAPPAAIVAATPAPAAAKPRVAGRPSAAPAVATVVGYDIDRDTYVYDTGRPIVLTLGNGSTQKVGANSSENRLYTFLATAAVQVDSVNRTKGWINFDRVYFEPGSATLARQSWPQLHNIANILKMFPNSIVKVGGYTDSVGLPLHNLELSEARARRAMLALAELGVSADHLQAKGYGAKYFVAPNTTPANRALNRRVSIRVVKK